MLNNSEYILIKNEKLDNIVFIHDIRNSAKDSFNLFKDLDLDYNYYSFDLPNHGSSEVDLGRDISIKLILDKVIEFVTTNKIDKIIFILDSMPTLFTKDLEDHFNSDIKRFILINPLNRYIKFSSLIYKNAFFTLNKLENLYYEQNMIFNIKELLNNQEWLNSIHEKRENIWKNEMQFRFLINDIFSWNKINKYLKKIKKINNNYDIILSENDIFCDYKENLKLFSNFQASTHILKNTGHDIIWDNKEEYINIIKGILK